MISAAQKTSKKDLWQQLNRGAKAHFVEGEGLQHGTTIVEVGPWSVSLDSYPVIASYVDVRHAPQFGALHLMRTRIRAPYVTRDGFRFWVYHKTRLSGVRKLFGMQDIATGYPEFDGDFVLRANDESKARALFEGWNIHRLLIENPTAHLLVKENEGRSRPPFPETVRELCIEIPHSVTDMEEMTSLCELFAEALYGLCVIGSACEEDPHMVL